MHIVIITMVLAAPLRAALLEPVAIDRYLDGRDFVSQEELLQLFYDVYHERTGEDVRLDRNVIRYLQKRLDTYVPLKQCEGILLTDDTLRIRYSRPQKVPVPGMWRQAKLLLSRELVFHVTAVPGDAATLRFEIVRGYVNVRTSRLAKMLNEFACDVEGTALLYRFSAEHRRSAVGLEEHVHLPGPDLALTVADTLVTVDAVHPRFPESTDLVFTPSSAAYFGFTAELRGPDTLRYQDWKPFEHGPAYRQFSALIDTVFADPHRAFAAGLTKTQTVTFNLEAGRGSFTRGFRFGR